MYNWNVFTVLLYASSSFCKKTIENNITVQFIACSIQNMAKTVSRIVNFPWKTQILHLSCVNVIFHTCYSIYTVSKLGLPLILNRELYFLTVNML